MIASLGKTEKAGFHAIGEKHHYKRHNRIYIGHYTIFGSLKHHGVHGYKTPVEKTPNDAAQSIYSRVFYK